MAKKRCRHCRCLFTLSARNPDQKYCSHPDCQRARKREWQRQKIKDDAGYRGNQKDAQTRWRLKNPDYWKKYRKKHPKYVQRNREGQLRRNKSNRPKVSILDILDKVAKMDALNEQNNDISGYYGLVPCSDILVAKMDAKIVKITYLSDCYHDVASDCKEMTR
jgi:hypothetical protein